MEIKIKHTCTDYQSFRAEKVKSLFNSENAYNWEHTASIPIESNDWRIGIVVGPSGSGKSSIGRALWPGVEIYNPAAGWSGDQPIIDCINPDGELNQVTAALSAVGLGNVPSWLRLFNVLSNGEQFRAGLARLICEEPDKCIVDEFTSVVDRQIAKIGAAAFAKSWRRGNGGQVVLLSCHYDILEWVEPDWIYDTREGVLAKKSLAAPNLSCKFGRQTAVTGSILRSITI